ncbi:MAG: hypothetical protein ABI599_07225 [Flavobacteriales bacterium]
MKKLIIPTIVAAALFTGCKDDAVVPNDLGYGYWPTNTGHWVEYEVDSTFVDERNDQNIRFEAHYNVRELLDSQYVDPEGRVAQRIVRSVLDTTGAWIIKDVWTQTRDNTAAEKTEENLRKLKLVFPVRSYQHWNAHVYIGDDGLEFTTDDELEVEYGDVAAPWSNGVLASDSTCTVVGTYQTNFVVTKVFEERYAKNIGMVDKLWMEYNKQDNLQDTTGFRLTMKAVAYGN